MRFLSIASMGLFLLLAGNCSNRATVTKTGDGAQVSRWIPRTPVTSTPQGRPTAGEDFAMIYDPIKHRIVMFGGKNDRNANINEVWTFDLSERTWKQSRTGVEKPPPSEDHTLTYDPVGYRMILFGGEDGPTRNIVWSYDLRQEVWRDMSDSTAPPREDHTAIFDSKRKRMVVFGGQENPEMSNEIWALGLDPTSPNFEKWEKLAVNGEAPLERMDHVAVYDSLKDRMVIYGGWDDYDEIYLDETWAFLFQELKWVKIKTKKSFPPKRRHSVGVYDKARNWLIIQGGFGSEGYLNDVWAFDLSEDVWINITPGPQPRIDHDAIYDPKSQTLILYGGDAGIDSKFRDIWQLKIEQELPLRQMLEEAGAKFRKASNPK